MNNGKNNNYWSLLRRHWLNWILITVIVMAVSMAGTLVQKPKFLASTQILIIQKDQKVDPYTASKSAELISNTLAEVAYSSSFMNRVLQNDTGINDDFGQEPVERQENWQKDVKTRAVSDTGIIEIETLDEDPKQAASLAKSIAQVYVDQGSEYHGGGKNIEIKNIDEASTSLNPVSPNLAVNLGVALILGLLLGAVYIISRYRKVSVPGEDNGNAAVARAPSFPLTPQTPSGSDQPPVQKELTPEGQGLAPVTKQGHWEKPATAKSLDERVMKQARENLVNDLRDQARPTPAKNPFTVPYTMPARPEKVQSQFERKNSLQKLNDKIKPVYRKVLTNRTPGQQQAQAQAQAAQKAKAEEQAREEAFQKTQKQKEQDEEYKRILTDWLKTGQTPVKK